jgi:hypothetical protein
MNPDDGLGMVNSPKLRKARPATSRVNTLLSRVATLQTTTPCIHKQLRSHPFYPMSWRPIQLLNATVLPAFFLSCPNLNLHTSHPTLDLDSAQFCGPRSFVLSFFSLSFHVQSHSFVRTIIFLTCLVVYPHPCIAHQNGVADLVLAQWGPLLSFCCMRSAFLSLHHYFLG